MNFISFAFAALLLAVMAVRFSLGREKRGAAYLGTLLLASLVFYAWHVPVYLPLLLLSAVTDFEAGRRIAAQPEGARARRIILVVSLAINLGLLGFFKYADFGLAETERMLHAFGVDGALPRLDWVLPIGISFYTFQSVSYTIDVYRGTQVPERRFWAFLLYVGFFPQLVAGPIVRAREFLYQIDRPRRLHLAAFTEGAYRILLGLFLKMVCADNVGIFVDVSFSAQQGQPQDATTLALATLLFSCQIFCDFAGYTNIARGVAYWLGFRLPENFDNPYVARSFNEFWQRWHITLSQWLRDYLYIPLGGNRRGRARTHLNLLLVMGLCGLWHGASATFVAWGLVHGGAMVVERLIGLHSGRGAKPHGAALRGLWFCVVQLTVLLAWIPFRSTSLSQAGEVLSTLATGPWGPAPPDAWGALVFAVPVLVMHLRGALSERGIVASVGPRERAVLSGVMLVCILSLYGQASDFIYFQF